MAIIPKREPTREITTEPGVAPRSPDVAGVSGRITQILGETLKGIADKFQEARTLEEVTKADTEATIKLNEIQLEAAQDPDVWNAKKYQDKISKVRTEASKGISIPAARNRFQAEFERDAIAADFNIRKTMRARQIDSMKASMLENIEALEETYTNAATPEERKLVEFKRDKIIDENVRLDVIDKEAAFKFKEKTKKQWQESAIRDAIANDATLAKEMLLAGDFKDLTTEETADWVEQAEKKIEKNKKVAEELMLQDQTQKEGALLTEVVDGLRTPKDIIELQARGDISLEMAKTTQMIMFSADNIATRESDEKEYNSLVDQYLMLKDGDLEALRKFRISIGTAFATGKLTHDDAALLTSRTIDPLVDQEVKKKQKGLFALAVGIFKNWARVATQNSTNAIFLMTKELINRIKDKNVTEENIEEESQAIIEDAKKVLNPNRAQFKVGDIVDTPAGAREIVGFDVDGEPLVKRVK